MADYGFETTHWSVVMASKSIDDAENTARAAEARRALNALLTAYYEPVRAFISAWLGADEGGKRYGNRSALDLTHDFFAEFLEKGVGRPSPDQGRFRSYLLGRVKHFLAHTREKSDAVKRGGGAVLVSLDTMQAETLTDPAVPFPSDAWFDRHWAETTAAAALEAVKAESNYPPELVDRMTGEIPKELRARLAKDYAMSDTAVKVAIHLLRRRFRAALRRIVAETLDAPIHSPAVEEEIAYLTAALTAGRADSAD